MRLGADGERYGANMSDMTGTGVRPCPFPPFRHSLHYRSLHRLGFGRPSKQHPTTTSPRVPSLCTQPQICRRFQNASFLIAFTPTLRIQT